MADRDGAAGSVGGTGSEDLARPRPGAGGPETAPRVPPPAGPPDVAAMRAAVGALTQPPPIRVVRPAGRRTADLRAQLDEKAAATDELREALDELRQVLDVEGAPRSAPPRRRRGPLVLGGVAVVAAGALGFALLGHDGGRIVAPAASSPSGSAAGGSASAPSPAIPSVPVRALPWPGGAVTAPPGLATSGPGVDAPGTDVQAAVDPDRTHVDVFERFVAAAPQTDPLELRLPDLPSVSGRAAVTDLQVELDGAGVPVVASAPGVWRAAANATWSHAVVRYRVAEGVVVVQPAAAGRALAVVPPLTGARSLAAGSGVVVHATGEDTVTGVTCPSAPAAGVVCGSRGASGWSARLPAGSSTPVVVLQVTLPA